jgi:hypothetical protein
MSPGLSLQKLSATSKQIVSSKQKLGRSEQQAADYLQKFGKQVKLLRAF